MKLIAAAALFLAMAASLPALNANPAPALSSAPSQPLPADQAQVDLGRRLFYDADLSADGTLACAGCHEQRRGFADRNATRPGVHGDPGRRNVPGLANVGALPRLTYADPTVTTLEAQALIPLVGERPVEMGMKGMEAELARRLRADACYRKMFRRAFPQRRGRIDMDGVTAALAAFQRTMTATGSPHDHFLRGDANALSAQAQRGRTLFTASGCASCHAGPDLTDADYHRLEPASGPDRGLAEQSGRDADAGRFRTPSLRNVAVTGPWWHDGSATSIDDAIRRHPAMQSLSSQDLAALRAFLDGLTDPDFLTDPRLSRPDSACGKPL